VTGDSPSATGSRGARLATLLTRGQALFLLAIATAFLFGLQDHEHLWWRLGSTAFLVATALLSWNGVLIASAPHGREATWPRRFVILGYLLALVLLLGSILTNQQVVPSVVFGSASLGMALLIAKAPSLLPRTPAA
jgi:hypothetical protein